MHFQPLRQHVIAKVLKIVSKEVTGLCSITNPSLLRKTEKADLEKFDFELVCNEWLFVLFISIDILYQQENPNFNLVWRPCSGWVFSLEAAKQRYVRDCFRHGYPLKKQVKGMWFHFKQPLVVGRGGGGGRKRVAC